jgi:hypothetical protein
MRSWRDVAAALAVLLSLLSPTMVCAFPNAQMTPQEHNCCRQMKGRCGSLNMPASHNCCQTDMQARHFEALQSRPTSFATITTAAAVLPVAHYTTAPLVFQTKNIPQHSLPTSPPVVISVLRV